MKIYRINLLKRTSDIDKRGNVVGAPTKNYVLVSADNAEDAYKWANRDIISRRVKERKLMVYMADKNGSKVVQYDDSGFIADPLPKDGRWFKNNSKPRIKYIMNE